MMSENLPEESKKRVQDFLDTYYTFSDAEKSELAVSLHLYEHFPEDIKAQMMATDALMLSGPAFEILYRELKRTKEIADANLKAGEDDGEGPERPVVPGV